MTSQQPIAIVGIGGIFPGSPTLDAFWANIAAGRSLAKEPPIGRWTLPVDAAYDAQLSSDKVNSRRGCFIEDFELDPTGLAIDRELVQKLDPVYHLALHAGRAAWQDAKLNDADRSRIGLIIGNIALPTDASSAIADELFNPLYESKLLGPDGSTTKQTTDPVNRFVAGLPGGLLAQALQIGGGSFTLDAACASSLYALKYAVDELQAGRADAMLAGGLSRPDCLYTQMGFSQLRAISPTGTCSPFDEKADGLVVGEGCGIIVLKRLDDAMRDGDHVHATIAGIGLSNDIEGSLMQPASEGQRRAMQAAYAQADWQPEDVDLIECHGTGTPTGDAVEFASLQSIWGDQSAKQQCVIGSVKSNVGHLLTGAGAAGLVKTLLAMQNEKLPPTANFSSGNSKIDWQQSPFTVLREPTDWNKRDSDTPRRAAVSAFGFGGINAHVLLEQYETKRKTQVTAPSRKLTDEPIAIVGVAAQFGPWRTREQITRRLLGGDREIEPTQPQNWWGLPQAEQRKAYLIDEVALPIGRFPVPPTELADMLPQQLLMLQVAADALNDAGLEDGSPQRLDTGTFVGISLDLNTTNFHFRWQLENQAKKWAPHLNESQRAMWVQALREGAGPPLTANRVMGSLGGIVASRVARAFHVGGPSFTISSEQTSGLHALQRAARMLQQHELKTAIVGAVDFASDPRMAIGEPVSRILGDGAAALILKRLDDANRDGDTVYALLSDDAEGAIDFDAEPDVGYTAATGGLASVVKACLSLHHETHDGSYWLHDKIDGPRTARVTATSVDGNQLSVTLEQADVSTNKQPLASNTAALLACDVSQLNELANWLPSVDGSSVTTIAKMWRDRSPSQAKHAVAFVFSSISKLRQQIQTANSCVLQQVATKENGVYYQPNPTGEDGQIAFVFPGAGNQYANMGKQLGATFPDVLRQLDNQNDRLKSQFSAGKFWDGTPVEDIDHKDVIFAQVWLGSFISDVVTQFGIKPKAAIGYSLGETTSLFATRRWTARDEMLQRMNRSSLFATDLAGPCNSVRQAWRLDDDEQVDWLVGVINRPADEVREALKGRSRVYLLIVNTPNECIVGGDSSAVRRLVESLGCGVHWVSGVTTVHCSAAHPIRDAYHELHVMDTKPSKEMRFYSGIWGKAYELTAQSAADSILGQAMQPFDYSKVIESAYADGVRYFLEMGPGSSCSRMIGQILGDRPHMTISACTSAQDEVRSLYEMLACLIVQGIPVDLDALPTDTEEAEQDSRPMVRVQVGSAGFDIPSLPAPPKPDRQTPVEPAPQPEPVTSPPPMAARAPVGADLNQPIVAQMLATESEHAQTQEAFLQFNQNVTQTLSQALAFQMSLLQQHGADASDIAVLEPVVAPEPVRPEPTGPVVFSREMCMEFAIGSIGKMLGPDFAEADTFPTRVRLPDEPLQLVDRITELEGEPRSMASGRVATEHDILPGAWYLDNGRIPTCIAVEAGQADLFLSGYLGIDFETRGLAVYRLLDAVVTFHRPLPIAGQTIHYDIHIDHFFRQDKTYLFRFHFEATVDGEPLLSMREGCAGFFTEAELAAGKGIVQTAMDKRPMPGKKPDDWQALVPMAVESYTDEQVNALRRGDLAGCFGELFADLPIQQPSGIPSGRMTLVHRILKLDPTAGRFGLGQIVGEADIAPDDWFLTCHFFDDHVMPGTLMYECCLHTLRILLLRMGWVGEADQVVYEPIPGQPSQLKCRGQVIETTKKVQYELTLKEIGYLDDGTPYVIADALMYGDGKPIVQMNNMSLRLSGLTREGVEAVWKSKTVHHRGHREEMQRKESDSSLSSNSVPSASSVVNPLPGIFENHHILAFAEGNPSEAFGDRYKVFDSERKIARLPRPPYKFLDRIVRIENCEQWVLSSGAEIDAEYDVPVGEWYFGADRQPWMPFAVLLEAALQPCGWLAAYLGSALTSEIDLRFRNLGGKAILHRAVTPDIGTLRTRIRMTNFSQSAGMIIQHFDMDMQSSFGPVYNGTTYFGFFSAAALADQIGIRDADLYVPSVEERQRGRAFEYPTAAPYPDDTWRMIDRIDLFDPAGGPDGLGYIEGSMDVRPDAWFFRAHFYQDPVVPGSLGLESFQQLLKVIAMDRWPGNPEGIPGAGVPGVFESITFGQEHEWIYRGQVVPTDKKVVVQATVKQIDDINKSIVADGFLTVDGRIIYQMKNFGIRMSP